LGSDSIWDGLGSFRPFVRVSTMWPVDLGRLGRGDPLIGIEPPFGGAQLVTMAKWALDKLFHHIESLRM
jgi:hypothetical protein